MYFHNIVAALLRPHFLPLRCMLSRPQALQCTRPNWWRPTRLTRWSRWGRFNKTGRKVWLINWRKKAGEKFQYWRKSSRWQMSWCFPSKVISGKIEEITVPEQVADYFFFNYFVWSFPSNSLFFKGGRNHIWADGLHAPQWEDAGDFLARQEVLETGRKNVPQQVETSFTFTLSFSNLNLESFIRGDLHVAPFTDEALYMEQFNKVGTDTIYEKSWKYLIFS